MKAYLAGPLFSRAELDFNLRFAALLTAACSDLALEFVLPQDRSAELVGQPDFLASMYRFCLDQIDRCDVVVCVLEGADADSDTCVEIGYAVAKRRPIVGLRTDLRSSEDRGVNLMVAQSCDVFVWSPSASLEKLALLVGDALRSIARRDIAPA